MVLQGGEVITVQTEIILYSTGCPKCNVLKKKLQQKGIPYTEVNDVELMKEKGYLSVPVLESNGASMDFKAATEWVNKQEAVNIGD